MTRVMPPDLELWLTRYLREIAAAEGIEAVVDNKEPADLALPLDRPLIVVRDDSGTQLGPTTFDRSVGVSVLASTRGHPAPANDLARWVAAVVFDADLPLVPGGPIAAVVPSGCNGPYPVPDPLDVSRRYLTAQYVVTGSW